MVKSIFRNFSAAFSANIINLLVTVFVTLYLPKFSSIEAYAQWQLYLFYTSYLWIISFGWPEGLYLRYGGKEYNAIDKKPIKIQFLWVVYYLVLILPLLAIFCAGKNNFAVMIFVFLDSAIEIPREAFIKLLQATNRTIDYSKILISSRLLFLLLIFLGSIFVNMNFYYMVITDVATKAVGLVTAGFFCKDIVKVHADISNGKWKVVLSEFIAVLSSGSKLMFGNLCSMFIVGIVRLAIQNQWGLIAFSKVSLTLSISNLFGIFITAISLVLFPALKNLSSKILYKLYIFIENILMLVMFSMLLLYYPIEQLLKNWLPQYNDGLQYMAILFPICIFQSKTSLLANTYQKALGLEKWIFIVNMGVLLLSIGTTMLTIYYLNSLDLAIFSIVVLLILRNVFSEITVWRVLRITRIAHVIGEIILTIIFISASWFVGGVSGLIIYAAAYFVWLFIRKKDVALVIAMMARMLHCN